MAKRNQSTETGQAAPQSALRDAVRDARIEAAERSGVVVDLRDRGISRGDVPWLWIDAIAHIEMGRDKRQYRFVQDTRYGRTVLAESYEVSEMVHAVTRYVARRLVERERALTDDAPFGQATAQKMVEHEQRRGRYRAFRTFIYGVILGVAALFALALIRP